MHFLTLVTVNIPPQEPEPEMDLYIADQAAMLQQKKEDSTLFDSCLLDIYLEKCNSLQNSFSRAVDYEIAEIMDRYSLKTENPDYLEFCDRTDEIKKEYSTAKVGIVKTKPCKSSPLLPGRLEPLQLCHVHIFDT